MRTKNVNTETKAFTSTPTTNSISAPSSIFLETNAENSSMLGTTVFFLDSSFKVTHTSSES